MRLRTVLRKTFMVLGLMLSGVVLGGLFVYVKSMRARPALQPWHLISLDEEYQAGDPDSNFDDYLAREERLFAELQREVIDAVAEKGPTLINRFDPESETFPGRFSPNWNRSFVLEPPHPRGAILLLHGLSDSPYSMRALGSFFAEQGLVVVGLRLPGHGTAPGALAEVVWEDWAAVVRLVAPTVRAKAGPEGKFFVAGYSNGAALSVEYAVESLEAAELPVPDGLFLFSPAIGVSPLAFLAKFQLWLSRLPGMEKLAWLDILPEYDTYKYNSFPVNAGQQIYRLTSALAAGMVRLKTHDRTAELPPILSFGSVVDATVPVKAIIDRLYDLLLPNGSEVVIFDVNRAAEMEWFVLTDFDVNLQKFLEREDRSYSVTLVTNRGPETLELVARRKGAGAEEWVEEPLDLAWPRGIYSLSHVAIPFSPEDPLYGSTPTSALTLGNLEIRGERGVLSVPLPLLMRLRYNPFYAYMEARVGERLEESFAAAR